MEATKKCPYCGEEIMATAKKCKHCSEWLETQPPIPPQPPITTLKESSPNKETEEEPLSFFEYYLDNAWNSEEAGSWKPKFDFSGTMPRKQFWIASFFISLIYGSLYTFFMVVASLHTGFSFFKIFIYLAFIGYIIKTVEMQIRRLRDTNTSPWFVILSFIPFLNLVPIIMFLQKGSEDKKTVWQKKDSIGLIALFIFIASMFFIASFL